MVASGIFRGRLGVLSLWMHRATQPVRLKPRKSAAKFHPKVAQRTRFARLCFQSTRPVPFPRQSFVTHSVATRTLVCLLATPFFGAQPELKGLLDRIQTRYNHAQSLKLDFSETYMGTKAPVQSEKGVLYLKKPGRMRWEYTAPAGKLFLSDGKEVLTWTPADNIVEKGKLKESEDVHAPIAFLLGKLDFQKEFKSFETHLEGSDTWIAAKPKSENLAWSGVDFLASPEGEIRRVRITLQDQSKLSFTFSNEQLNVPVAPSMFTFQAPPGAQISEAGQ